MGKKVIVVNGSPRKQGNTGILLQKALEGAAAQGAETELIHLYDLDFKGCTSCFACKRKGGKSYGQCAMRDELTPVLSRIAEADGLLLGSPIYFFGLTGVMRSFLERLLFQHAVYELPPRSLFTKPIGVGMIYTMNIDQEQVEARQFLEHLKPVEQALGALVGAVQTLHATDTYQFDDYSLYVVERFDPVQKAQHRAEEFPRDCEAAFRLGAGLVTAES